jgi:hypothetical protein
VLDRPADTNSSERDIRLSVTKRNVAALAAPMNATAATLMRTAAQSAIAFWDYLGDLLRTFGQLQTRPPSAPTRLSKNATGLPLLRNGSISPTKGWKNSESEAHVESGRTRCLRGSQELGGA